MTRDIRALRIRGVRRKQIDEDKIALAYLLLAKQIIAERDNEAAKPDEDDANSEDEAAA